jgi:hypothetical protein
MASGVIQRPRARKAPRPRFLGYRPPGMRSEPLSDEIAAERARLLGAAAGPFDATQRVIAIGSVELPERITVSDPAEHRRCTVEAACRAGLHEIVALESNDGGTGLQAVVLRRPGATAARWCVLDLDVDEHVTIGPADAAIEDFPGLAHPDARDARCWVHLGRLEDSRSFVWIEDPTGSGAVQCSVGLDRDGAIAAILVDIYGAHA